MANYFVDYENGDDGNSGEDWANAKKTLAGCDDVVAAGDTVKIAKSPDPVSLGDALFTNNSDTIELDSPLTLTIENGETNWTNDASLYRCEANNHCVEGSYAAWIMNLSAFPTGLLAHKTITELDLSGYEKISFMFYPGNDVPAGTLQIVLCSDNDGLVEVNNLTIDQALNTNKWYKIVIDNGGALGASIKSIGVKHIANTLPAGSLYFDNFVAANGFTHKSLIGKNAAGESWYSIQSIDGTTVKLGYAGNSAANQKYPGATETVTAYRREYIDVTDLVAGDNYLNDLEAITGTKDAPILYEGGYNTSNSTRDGETFYGTNCYEGTGIYTYEVNYLQFKHLGMVGLYYGFYFDGGKGFNVDDLYWIDNYNGDIGFSLAQWTIGTFFINNGSAAIGLELYDSVIDQIIVDCLGDGTNSGTFSIGGANNTVNTLKARNHTSSESSGVGLYLSYADRLIIKKLITADNDGYGISIDSIGQVFIKDWEFNETTPVYFQSYRMSLGQVLVSENHDNTAGNEVIFTYSGTIQSETSIRHTASGLSWKMTPTDTENKLSLLPRHFKSFVEANKEITLSVYVRKDSSYNGNAPRLVLKGGVLTGITNDVTDSLTVAADNWEQLVVTATPTEEGFIEFYVDCDGDAGSIYVDDIDVAQA